MPQVTREELRIVPQFSDLPDDTIQWILDRSDVYTFGVDEILTKTGQPIEEMWIILTGNYDFYWDTNGHLTYIRSWKTGDIAGLLPYSRLKTSPGYAISTEAGRGLLLHKRYFDEMEKQFPDLVKRLVEILTDRVREFTASHQQQEKMSALGRMSAGLAHELNNPASAIQRTAAELNTRLISEIDRVMYLIDSHPEKNSITKILREVQAKAADSYYNRVPAIEKAKYEDELSEMLSLLPVNERTRLADTFADFGVTPDDLNEYISAFAPDTAGAILLWIENVVIAERLVSEIQKASTRISELVNSIKSYVHLDRSQTMKPTDVHEGLESTLILLNHKLKRNNIKVVKNFAEKIPHIHAMPGELNQVWTNLIDNAIDAMDNEGTLTLFTSIERNMVKVCIIDTGHGIPTENKNKIFDPFFTTKPIGKGVGLGLDLVKGIIMRHHGTVQVSSEPGRTEFIVFFPLNQKSTLS